MNLNLMVRAAGVLRPVSALCMAIILVAVSTSLALAENEDSDPPPIAAYKFEPRSTAETDEVSVMDEEGTTTITEEDLTTEQGIRVPLDIEQFSLPAGPEEMLHYMAQDYVQIETELTLVDAILMALENNHGMNAARLRSAAACESVDIRWAELGLQGNMRLNSYVQESSQSEISIGDDGEDTIGGTEGDVINTFALELSQRIWDFGETRDSADQAEALHAVQNYVVNQAEQQLVTDVINSWFQFNLALGFAKVRKDEHALALEFLRQAGIQFDAGVVPKLDVVRAETRVEQAWSSLIAARSNVGNVSADFFALLGVDDQRYVPMLVERNMITVGTGPLELNEAIAIGQDSRPEVLLQYNTLFAQEATIELTQNRPTVEAYANAFYRDPVDGFTPSDSYEFGLRLNWNVLDGGRRSAQKREAELTLAAISQDILELETQIERDVTKSWNRVVTARANADALKKNLELSNESLRVAFIGYRAGVTPYLDFMETFDGNVVAALQYLDGLVEVRLAHTNLSRAMGYPFSYPGDTRAGLAASGSVDMLIGLEEPAAYL